MRSTLAILLIVCELALAGSASAQSAQAVSIQGSILYSGLAGDAFPGFRAGAGIEAQLRYTTTVGFSIGAGYQRTTHGIDGASGNATLAGPFVEPRYTFEIKGHDNVYPYASIRLSSLKQTANVGGINSTASGFTTNAGGGLLFRIASRANLDVGATYGITNFSDFVLVDPSTGQRVTGGKTGSGSNFVLRTGLAIGLF
jgi:hypothetical protein